MDAAAKVNAHLHRAQNSNTNMHAQKQRQTHTNRRTNADKKREEQREKIRALRTTKPVCIICDGILLFPLSTFRLINQFWLLFKINLNGMFFVHWNVCSRYVSVCLCVRARFFVLSFLSVVDTSGKSEAHSNILCGSILVHTHKKKSSLFCERKKTK